MLRLCSVAAALLAFVGSLYCQSVSWCVDSENLKIGIATVAASALEAAVLGTRETGPQLRQIYAGAGLNCRWLTGIQMIEPMPTYSLQRELALEAKVVDVARLTYLRGSVVLDRSIGGRVEHHVVKGIDILNLGGDLDDTSIIHVSKLEWRGTQPRVQVFVKTGRPLTQELGRHIARAVAQHLDFQPWYVNVRNDVYFVGRGYPLRYPFVEGDMPSVEAQKGTVTLTCLNKEGDYYCASTWE